MSLSDKLGKQILFFDGAMGTMLQQNGLPIGGLPDLFNISHPETVVKIHKEYVEAGVDIISTNTFQANEWKLAGRGYSVKEVVQAGVINARRSGAEYVALDVGPLGQLMEPMGTVTFDQVYEVVKRQVIAGAQAGADCVLIETISDPYEAKAAILAVKENSDLPVFCTMTYQEDGRTFMGCDPVTAVLILQGLGVDALGVNCSLGPKELGGVVEQILDYAKVPVLVQANAGLPEMVDGETVYTIDPEDFSTYVENMVQKGVALVGGCCGTTPNFIRAMKTRFGEAKPLPRNPRIVTAACSGSKTVVLDERVSVIGERINPTGKKKLKAAIRSRDLDYIIGEALDQKEAGADILDVNVGLPEIDEPEMMAKAVREIQAAVNLPLQIDSSDPAAIEVGVRLVNGRPMINSVNGKKESMDVIFPIAKKYGTLVVGLTLDEKGIPETAEGRCAIAEKIVEAALAYGIPKENILIDTLVLTASAQQEQVIETLKAIRLVKQRLGVKTVLGVSNVSFGLPTRELLNATFLSAAFGAGLDAPILNPMSPRYMGAVDAFRVLNYQDKNAEKYIEKHSQASQAPVQKAAEGERSLDEVILQGRKEEAGTKTRELLQSMPPLEIINTYFIPALDEVGSRFEKGQLFLPQLMQSAETVKKAFGVLKDFMESSGNKPESKGKILLATVKGDIHDIGKNIVRMLLENYGYDVIDLGKDVPIESVVETVREEQVTLVGLSALMTTTVQNMRDTISAVKAEGLACSFMVGGAVLNEEYKEFVGADYYAKDAMESVAIANRFFEQ